MGLPAYISLSPLFWPHLFIVNSYKYTHTHLKEWLICLLGSTISYLNCLTWKISFCYYPSPGIFCVAAEKIESVRMQLAARPLLPIPAGVVQLTAFVKAGPLLIARATVAGIPLVRARARCWLCGGRCWWPHCTTGHRLALPLLLLTVPPVAAVRSSSQNAPQQSKLA